MTKDDIKLLMRDKKKPSKVKEEKIIQKKEPHASKKPIINDAIKQYYLDTNFNSQAIFYPSLYASIELRFYNKMRGIDIVEDYKLSLPLDSSQNLIVWNDVSVLENTNFSNSSNSNISYAPLPAKLKEVKSLKEFEKKLSNHLYYSKKLELFKAKEVRLESKVGQSKRDFLVEVEDKLKELRDEKLTKLQYKYELKFNRFEKKLKQLDIKLQKEQTDVGTKTTNTIIDVGMAIFGSFLGRKTISATTMRRGASAFKKGKSVFKERDDVKLVESQILDAQQDIQELNEKLQDEILKIEEKLDIENYEIESIFIKPRRSDIIIKDFALLWQR